ncbi:MAG: 7TM-DISM domain-containing protein [Spirosomataceae bacterium]
MERDWRRCYGYFVDSTNDLSYAEVAKIPDAQFLNIPDKIINLGFSSYRIWFKFDLENQTNEVLYALFLAQDIDFIDALLL